ncbi:hypothetical protein D9758_009417 [Tetrapyrgos nigripes]|uniref:Carboxylic ester hydrolase n=1 Tax=Tetrapyrgos nigripes TaxID=182062 RepID=A0A8H5D1U2_9AGAR|nr:hypothetical protein D9758_009417 [Tetrapyrgos nigripes]
MSGQTYEPDDFVESLEVVEEQRNKRVAGIPCLPPTVTQCVSDHFLGGINTSLPPPYERPERTRFLASQPRILLSFVVMLSFTVWALIVFATLSSYASDDHPTPPSVPPWVVNLDYGTFVGVQDQSTGITSFKGIRFADAPPFGPSCVSLAQSGSEDCLFGNVCANLVLLQIFDIDDPCGRQVFLPNGTTRRDRLPVLVWFHGGGFQSSSTRHFDPVELLQSTAKPFIFVSFAYRLAGSKIKEDGDLNVGLLDQFGGDPSRVTIWGQSAGAGSNMFHLIAQGGNNEGLFHAAMGDSPSLTFTPFATGDYLEGIFSQYASFAGCDPNAQDALKCLRSADISVLKSAGAQLDANRTSTLFIFAPILDGKYITERPVEAFASGRFARVPVFFGSNTNEGANWSAGLPNPSANTSEPDASEETVYNFFQGQWASLTKPSFDRALQLYPLANFGNSFSQQGAQMYGDMRYICTAGMITGSLTRAGLPAFRYHYDNSHLGDFHHNELQAMFPEEVPPVPADDKDLALFEAMREYWTSFVTNDRPSSKSAGVAWRAVRDTSNGSPRLLASPGLVQNEQISEELSERCAMWRSLAREMQT